MIFMWMDAYSLNKNLEWVFISPIFFQLGLFYEATVPRYETISGTLPQC